MTEQFKQVPIDHHVSVMKAEALSYWYRVNENVSRDLENFYIDATYGRGGHSLALIGSKEKKDNHSLLVIDKDVQAIEHAEKVCQPRAKAASVEFHIRHGSFAQITEFAASLGWQNKVAGILIDLGVSSPQLDQPERGFSFSNDGPLDMRMDDTAGMSAAEWIATASESAIRQVLWDYGEEKNARRIAKAIISSREETPITRTKQLADLISAAVPKVRVRSAKPVKHPATKTFQAIRIFLNGELSDLKCFLPKALDLLAIGGRLVVISFHSLEDRIVKRFMRDEAKGDPFPKDFPIRDEQLNPRVKLLAKGVKPTDDEVETNVRSRSAVLRVAEKISV